MKEEIHFWLSEPYRDGRFALGIHNHTSNLDIRGQYQYHTTVIVKEPATDVEYTITGNIYDLSLPSSNQVIKSFTYYIKMPQGVGKDIIVTYGPDNIIATPGSEITLDLSEPYEQNSQISTSDFTTWWAFDIPQMMLQYNTTDNNVGQWFIGSGGYERITNKIWGSDNRAASPQHYVNFTIDGFGTLSVKYVE